MEIRKRKVDYEGSMQRTCVAWFDAQYPSLSKLLFAVPNGGKRNKITANKMKHEGVRSGVADLVLSVPTNKHHATYLEAKVVYQDGTKNYQSKDQKEFQKLVESMGYRYEVFYSLEEFIKIVKPIMYEVLNESVR